MKDMQHTSRSSRSAAKVHMDGTHQRPIAAILCAN